MTGRNPRPKAATAPMMTEFVRFLRCQASEGRKGQTEQRSRRLVSSPAWRNKGGGKPARRNLFEEQSERLLFLFSPLSRDRCFFLAALCLLSISVVIGGPRGSKSLPITVKALIGSKLASHGKGPESKQAGGVVAHFRTFQGAAAADCGFRSPQKRLARKKPPSSNPYARRKKAALDADPAGAASCAAGQIGQPFQINISIQEAAHQHPFLYFITYYSNFAVLL